MNKQDLELKIAGLEKAIKEHVDFADTYKTTLADTKQQLEDLNKPVITPMMIDNIYCAVEQAVGEFDFTDTNNYEIDYSLDYDGRVQCESHEFINDSDLCSMIVSRVCSLFKEVDCPTDEDETND